ncbi:MAG TPA: DUF6624 domain-containing protein [Allosphingosinicella sp.]|jgi:hypothetical protein
MPVLLALLAAAALPPAPPRFALAWAAAPAATAASLDPVRGALPGASDAEATAWRDLKAYADACILKSAEATRTELRALGYEPTALSSGAYTDRTCRAAQGLLVVRAQYDTWEAFAAARREAWPAFAAYRAAVRNAESVAQNRVEAVSDGKAAAAPLGERLAARVVGEQVLRLASADLSGDDGPSPPVTEQVSAGARPLLEALLSVETARHDERNTDWLRAEVERSGWPARSTVGGAGAEAAWLLVQHADHDPAFQARMLKLMAPLAARGDVPRRNYAFLYDRVMMKVAGRQRYATQYRCENGHYRPAALEDPARVEALRAEAGLGTVAENTARIERLYGRSCAAGD